MEKLNLNFEYTNIGHCEGRNIYEFLENLKNIEELNLNFKNNSVGMHTDVFSKAIKKFTFLKLLTLNFENNALGDEAVKDILLAL